MRNIFIKIGFDEHISIDDFEDNFNDFIAEIPYKVSFKIFPIVLSDEQASYVERDIRDNPI